MDLKERIFAFISDKLRTANRNNMKSKYLYSKILKSLNETNLPILRIEDLDSIKNIGKKTKELIIKEFFKPKASKVKKLPISNEKTENFYHKKLEINEKQAGSESESQNESVLEGKIEYDGIKNISKNSNEILNLSDPNPKNVLSKKTNEEDIKENSSIKSKRELKYMPSFRSGGYAILKVLGKEDGISKHIISHRGNKYSEIEFNFNQRYSAWSSMKTLISKNLVIKESKKYFITDLGRLTVEHLFNEESTVIEEEKIPVLIIDSREMKSKKDRSFFQRELEKEVICETRNLHLGDFLWVYDEFVMDFIVERKKGSDFCASITDGRFNDQKKRLLSTGINNIFYVVEGLKDRNLQKIGVNYGLSCLASTKNDGFTVIETEDINETVEVVKIIDQHVRNVFKKSQFSNFEEENDIKLRYDDFIDKGTKNNNLKVYDILLITLLSIKGLSFIKAKCIAEKYKALSGLMKSYNEGNIFEELLTLETPKGLIGKSIVKKICKIIFDKDY